MKKTTLHGISRKNRMVFLLLCFVPASLLSVGCSGRRARAKDQDQGQVAEYPHYPVQQDQKAFTLTSGTENTVTYRTGTMLLLNPALNPKDLANLMEVDKSIRLARAAAVHYAANAEEAKRQYLKKIEDTQNEIKVERQRQTQKVSREQRLAHAADWFAAEMKNHAPAASLERIMDTFNGYCEAKIWQLAAQPYFASKRYLTRPTPLGFCENYYKEKGFFSRTAPSCMDAPTPEGKSYVQCLWEEGVLKTAIFNRYFLNKKEQFTALLSDAKREDFRLTLAAAMGNTDPDVVVGRLSGKIHQSIMNLAPLPPTNPSPRNKCGAGLWKIKLTEMCTLFAVSSTAAPALDGEMLAKEMTPAAIINLVESGKADSTQPRVFALPDRADTQISYQNLILFFGARSEKAPSESDVIFNQLAAPDDTPADGLTEISTLSDTDPEDYRAALDTIYAKASSEDEAVIAGLLRNIEEYQNAISQLDAQAGKYDKKVTDLLNAGIAAAKSPDLAYAFMNLGLQMGKKRDTYELEFWFGDDNRRAGDQKKRIKSCYNTTSQANLAATACLDHPGFQLPASEFTYRPETGELLFAFGLDQIEAMGFKGPDDMKNSSSDYFNAIPFRSLVGTTMEFQLFPNTIDGVVNILTGKVFVKAPGWVEGDPYLYEGVVSIFDNN